MPQRGHDFATKPLTANNYALQLTQQQFNTDGINTNSSNDSINNNTLDDMNFAKLCAICDVW